MKTAYSLLALCALAGCTHSPRPTPMPAPSPRPRPSEIRAEDIDRAPGSSIEELLAAKVPGVQLVRGMDGRTVLHIRGLSTLADDGEPLYVVNGVALGSSSSLAALDRHDIESVEVLNDPASMAMWGMRGSNGVIVIRTKRS